MRKSPKLLSALVFTLWIASCVLAFWWFQFRHLGPFDNQLAAFDGSTLSQLQLQPTANQSALVVHFIDPDCPCSRFSTPHIKELENRFARVAEFKDSSWVTSHGQELHIPATPAVAIWNQTGELAYFGPYSGGAVCGEGSDYVEMVFRQLQKGFNPQWINLDAVGCFCPYSESNKVAMR